MTSSIVFLNGNPLFFFLDSDSPFNCLNASIKNFLPYVRKFLRKKKVGKNKFFNEQKQTFAAHCIILGYFQIIITVIVAHIVFLAFIVRRSAF
jgi:hypothetical protein